MENIELFDRYIDGKLSAKERSEFDARLISDGAFAAEFKLYTATVIGICKEAEQDNLDFGIALKQLTKEQLRDIIGGKKAPAVKVADKRPLKFRFKPILWQITSAAAMVAIVITCYFGFQRQASHNVDNAIAMVSFGEEDLVRSSSGNEIDIPTFSDKELKEKLPELTTLYKSAEGDLEVANNGYMLAMAYLRLHDRKNARLILNEIVDRYKDNDDLTPEVRKCERVLNIIKD